MEDMKLDDHEALILKLSAKIKEMTDEELQDLAKELGVEEDTEKPADDMKAPVTEVVKPVVDTGALSGSLNGLKSFLIKKQQDNDRQV